MTGRLGVRERVLRGALGVALVAWAYIGDNPWGLLGLAFIANAATAWCPGYAAAGRLTGGPGAGDG